MAKLRVFSQPEKFVNAVAYLAQACPNSTKMTICKQLYYADKEHLVKFGRPIVGDHYHKLPHGPIPTRGLDILRKRSSEQEVALLEKYVSVIGDSIHPRQSPNRKVFSKSDIEVLDSVVAQFWPDVGCATAPKKPLRNSVAGFSGRMSDRLRAILR